MNGIGAHEVIIESPRHEDTLASMDERAVEQLRGGGGASRISKRDRRFRHT